MNHEEILARDALRDAWVNLEQMRRELKYQQEYIEYAMDTLGLDRHSHMVRDEDKLKSELKKLENKLEIIRLKMLHYPWGYLGKTTWIDNIVKSTYDNEDDFWGAIYNQGKYGEVFHDPLLKNRMIRELEEE
jgi:hypothetical protein